MVGATVGAGIAVASVAPSARAFAILVGPPGGGSAISGQRSGCGPSSRSEFSATDPRRTELSEAAAPGAGFAPGCDGVEAGTVAPSPDCGEGAAPNAAGFALVGTVAETVGATSAFAAGVAFAGAAGVR
jgi:hypothetical protein